MFDLLASVVAFFYKLTKSYGVSIVLITLVVRCALFPLTAKQVRSMQAMQKAAPEMKRLQAMYKDDKQKLNEEMIKFYREHKINPAASCLPLLLQIPILIIMYNVIRGLTHATSLDWLTIRVAKPKYISHSSELYEALVRSGGRMRSWGIDLAQSAGSQSGSKAIPYYLLVLAVVGTSYLQQRQSMKRSPANTPQAQQMQSIMRFLPIFTGLFTYQVQAALALYWLTGNLFTIAQQWIIYRKIAPPDPEAAFVDAVSSEKSRTGDSRPSLREALRSAREGTAANGASAPEATGSRALGSGQKTAGQKTAGQKPGTSQKPTGQKPTGQKTAGQKTAGQKPNQQPWVRTGKPQKKGKR